VQQLPKRYQDDPPEVPHLDPDETPSGPELPPEVKPIPPMPPLLSYRALKNGFGLFQHYLMWPSYKPGAALTAGDFVDSNSGSENVLLAVFDSSKHALSKDKRSPIWPFPNISSLLSLNWWHNGQTEKSLGECATLIQNVFHHLSFVAKDVSVHGLHKIEELLMSVNSDKENPLYMGEGWIQSSVTINVPLVKSVFCPFTVGGLFHCSIIKIVIAVLEKPHPPASVFHYTPLRLSGNHRLCITPITLKGFLTKSTLPILAFKSMRESTNYCQQGTKMACFAT
jgi:hypothetical protein